jgi:TP901 family phage tail tape measure protein
MPERVISYGFRANFGQFSAGLAAMGKSVDATGRKLVALDRNGQQMRAGLTTLGNAAGKFGLVAAAGVGVAIAAAANFEQAMSKVQAATHETAANMDLLRDAAIEAGARTVFSATEAAAAIENLAKAGVSTTDILAGGLDGALNLAAAGSLEVAQAAEIAATTLTQFGLGGDQATRVADVLAAAAGKAQGEVTDMAGAMKYVGPVAAQMGISLEETAGAVAELASQGILGEQAGTSLRGMLTSLTSPSKIAKKEMDALGISMYDASGEFIGLDGIAGQLNSTMSGLTNAERDQALGRIFGNEQITAARILYAGGAEAVQKWTAAVDDQGYAAETASIKMDNLKGDLEQLGGSLETLLIGAGSGSQGPLRSLVQGTTEAVNALGAVPGPAKSAATNLLAVTAVMGASIWAGSKVVNGIAGMKTALAQLGIEAVGTRAKLALVGTGGAAAALGIGTLVDTLSKMDSMSRSADAADATVQSFQDLQDVLSFSNVGKYADDLHVNLERLTQDLAENGAQGEYVQRVLDVLADKQDGFRDKLQGGAGELLPGFTFDTLKAERFEEDLRAIIEEANGPLSEQGNLFSSVAASIAGTIGPVLAYNGAISGSAEVNDEATQAILDSVEAMGDQKDAAVDAFDAITGYRQAMKDAAKQAKESDAGIKGNSDAALENRDKLSGLISAWNSLDQTVTDNVGKFKSARENFLATADAMKVPKEEAKRLWREMAKLPSSKVIPVSAPGASAAAGQVQTLNAALSRLVSKTITLTVKRVGDALPQFAAGGVVGMPAACRPTIDPFELLEAA